MSFWMQTFSYKALRRFADLITVYETEMGRSIADFFDGKPPVMFVKNGIDDSLGLASPKEYDLISVGGLRDSKGTLTSIKLCACIKARIPDVKMVLIGAGTVDYMKAVREAINDLGLTENITILGHLSQEIVYTFLSSSRFFVTCSQEEGWGIAVHEALINRTPVIGFELPAFGRIREFCTLVPQGDISALCDAFLRDYHDYGNSDQLGRIERGYSYASKLTWQQVLDPEIQVIAALFHGAR
ncbi:glycosyltransferase [Litoricolaceae bacterium]|nr:glycosyltransferase [Litorivicinaceae bacterium]